MRTLIHGLQSSGATLFNYCLSQDPETVCVLDLHILHLCPKFPEIKGNLIVKCAITTIIPFMAQKLAFKPDVTILFTRNYDEIRNSLSSKYYALEGGTVEDKIEVAKNLNPRDYDYVVDYQDFIGNQIETTKKLDEKLPGMLNYSCQRSIEDILSHACSSSQWLRSNLNKKWGQGNMRLPIQSRLVHGIG